MLFSPRSFSFRSPLMSPIRHRSNWRNGDALVKMSANCSSVGTLMSRMWLFWMTSCAKCLRISICFARSRPSMKWFPHSMHALLFSYTGVSSSCGKRMFRIKLPRYRISTAISDAEYYSASAVDSAIVFCILDHHNTIHLLYSANSPVDWRDSVSPIGISETIQSIIVSTPIYEFETGNQSGIAV